jgi:Glutathione peroxidase
LRLLNHLRYAGNNQQRQGEKMIVVRNRNLLIGLVILMTTSTFAASNLDNFTLNSIDGKPLPLADFKGKVVLIVNVASQC